MKPLFVYLLCFYASTCISQDNFINYTTKDGLPSNQVYDIYQDQRGIMWFATDRGLSSFNGSFFTNFSAIDGLLSEVIFDFFPQKDGTVWCSTNKSELFIFDPLKITFTPFKFNHLLPEHDDREVKSILLDDNGDFYFKLKGTKGYVKITADGDVVEHQLKINSSILTGYYINHLKEDFYYYSSNNSGAINTFPLDVAFRDMIVENTGHIARINYNYVEILVRNTPLRRVKLIDNGELLEIGKTEDSFWVTGYNIGAKIIDKKGEVVKTYLPNLPCSDFFRSKDGGLWISTLSHGVFYAPTTQINVFDHAKDQYITSISTDRNKMAFGTHAGSVVEYSFKTGELNQMMASTKAAVQYFRGVLYSNVTDQKSANLNSFIRKMSDHPNPPWLLTTAMTVRNIAENRAVVAGQDECYDAEHYGKRLLVSQETCIKIVDSNSNVLDSIDLQTTTIDLDVDNNLIYCATSTRGLLILDDNLDIIWAIDMNSGLESNFINEVAIRNEEIWLGTRNGISRITNPGNENQHISTIGVLNGLTDKEVTDLDFVGDTLFIGTRRGVNYFNVSNWDDIINSKASVFFSIKSVSQQGKELSDTERLAHYENDLTVEVALASYTLNNNILFRYKLEGLDNDWTMTRSRMLNFKSLPPGKYKLLIQANVNDHWHEKVLSQKIGIRPAWYTTWWFIVLVVISIITIVWLFFKYRILNYNRAIIQEILRQLLKRVKKKTNFFIVRSNGKDIRVDSEKVLYAESSRNYLTIYCENQKVIVRTKISDFLKLVPDPIEYVQIRRSVIVRKDKVTGKSKDAVSINNLEIKVGVTYTEALTQIHLS